MKGVIMRKSAIITFGLAAAFLAGSLSVSGQVSAQGNKDKAPSGFEQGKKTGWENQFPPGWENKTEKEKKKWEKTLQKKKEKIHKYAVKNGMSEMEAESAATDLEILARKGTDVKEAEKSIKSEIKRNKKDNKIKKGDGNIQKDDKSKIDKVKDKGKVKGKNK